jgi:hypothetical protein
VINADEKATSLNLVCQPPHIISFRKAKMRWKHRLYIWQGYNDYKALEHFTEHKTGFVTRIKENAKFEVTQVNLIPEAIHTGVLSDEIIEVDVDKEG